MGNFLDNPVETISGHAASFDLGNKKLQYALSSMQGWRASMEDAHIHLTHFPADPTQGYPELRHISLFGVFDGHGGRHTANFTSQNLLRVIMSRPAYKTLVELYTTVDHSINPPSSIDPTHTQLANLLGTLISEAFEALDEELNSNTNPLEKSTGTTAVCCFITQTHIITANLGDSRAIYIKNGLLSFQTVDHKPNNEIEYNRIINANLSVSANRICGDLALSRALGDFCYKNNDKLSKNQQAVSIEPDIQIIQRNNISNSNSNNSNDQSRNQSQNQDNYEFVVLACDGVWDVMSSEQVSEFIVSKLSNTQNGHLELKAEKTEKLEITTNSTSIENSEESNNVVKEQKNEMIHNSDKNSGNLDDLTPNGNSSEKGVSLKRITDELTRECMKSRDNVSVLIIALKEIPFVYEPTEEISQNNNNNNNEENVEEKMEIEKGEESSEVPT